MTPPDSAETVRLSDEERETVVSCIRGIEQGLWNPTPAMMRFVALIFRRLVWAGQDWRQTMADPCTCKPGTEGCPRESECFAAWLAWHHHFDGERSDA